ncbi:MAG: RidA family protein [Planctomycetes bacterium]|nr:RidA family protein [Planctomycetota bacterium]
MDIINPDDLAIPKGYNNGIKCGNLLAVAGQVAWDKNKKIIGVDNFARQFGQALKNVVSVVRKAGGLPSNIVKLTIFVTDKTKYLSSLKEVGVEYRAVMGKHFPAMTLVEVKGLVEPGALLEIEGLAYLAEK